MPPRPRPPRPGMPPAGGPCGAAGAAVGGADAGGVAGGCCGGCAAREAPSITLASRITRLRDEGRIAYDSLMRASVLQGKTGRDRGPAVGAGRWEVKVVGPTF